MNFREKIIEVLKANIGEVIEVIANKQTVMGRLKQISNEGVLSITIDENIIAVDEIIVLNTKERPYCKEDF